MAVVSSIRASSTVCAFGGPMQTVRRRNVQNHVQAQGSSQAHDDAIRVGIQHTARRLFCSSRPNLIARAATGERTIEREEVSFDLGLGVVLAGLAFDSYLEPEKPPELVEETLNRTQIMYTSKSYVAANLKGLFRVAVRKATNLPARDMNVFRVATSSDPYTVVTCGASSAKTDIIRNELNPVWDTVLYLFCWEGESMLKVNVYDDDLASADDRLGSAMINGEEYMDGHLHTLERPLVGDGGGGTLTVDLQFLSLHTGDEAVAKRIMEATTTSTRRKAPDSAPDVLREVALAMQGLTEGPDSPWQVLGRIVEQEAVTSEEPVAYIDNLDTDTQAWVYSNSDEKNLAIAFRGTEQVKWKDFITDLNLVPSDLNEERVNVGGFIPQGILDAVTGREDPKIHSGFLAAYDSIRPSLLRIVDTITGWDPDWTIYITGHSLGGALATICAHQLGVRRPGVHGPRITMYNYGAPRVGNKEFASQYREVVPDSWRIRNKKDIVASVPRLMGYSHVPTAVVLDMSGQMNVTINGSDVFGEGKDGAQVVREMVKEAVAKGLTQNFEEGMDVFEELLQHEMSILDSLTDGSAVMQHMEDLYLKSLRSCVELMPNITAEEVKLLKDVLGKKPL